MNEIGHCGTFTHLGIGRVGDDAWKKRARLGAWCRPWPRLAVALTSHEGSRISHANRAARAAWKRAPGGVLARSDRQVGQGRACGGEKSRETNLPAEQIGAQAPAWVSRAHGDQGWPQSRRGAAGARPQAAECVIGAPVPSVPVERLKRRSDFRAAAAGLRASGRTFVVQAHRRADAGAVRIGFTVSKRVGDAVERNRVRRRLREIVRLSAAAGTSGLCPGHDYVLIGRRAALAAPFGQMMRELDAALNRIQAIERGGTGGARREALHEAGSPSRSPKLRNRKQPPELSPKPSQEPPG